MQHLFVEMPSLYLAVFVLRQLFKNKYLNCELN